MMSYKLLKDGIVIDAVDAPVFVYYNQRLCLFLACDEDQAQGIASRDGTTYYHLSDKDDFCVDGYDTVDAEVISFEDARLIMDAVDAGKPLPEPPVEEPVEEALPDGALELVRSHKRVEMSAACEQAIYRGTDVELQDGTHHFSFTLQDQSSRNSKFRDMTSCKACGKCGLGSNKNASIHPNGNLYGCQEMTSNVGEQNIFYIGNIYSGVEDSRRFELMELFDKQSAVGDDCANCLYNRVCDGGCVANNYLINQDISVVPNTYCWWKRVVLDGAVRIMQTLGQEENAMFRKKWGGK